MYLIVTVKDNMRTKLMYLVKTLFTSSYFALKTTDDFSSYNLKLQGSIEVFKVFLEKES